MQRRLLGINIELRQEGLSEVGVGIGLHTGEVTVGTSAPNAVRNTPQSAIR